MLDVRYLYDSVTAANIPSDAQMVAGYLDGQYRWTEQDWQRFPTAQRVRIAVAASTQHASVYDVERGDLTPDEVPAVLARERQAGNWPTIYSDTSTWPEIRQACLSSSVALPPWWAAHPTGQPHLVAGSVATQFLWHGDYDLSLVSDSWPGLQGETDMQAIRIPAGPDAAWYCFPPDGHIDSFNVDYHGGLNTTPGAVGVLLDALPWTDEHGALGYEIRTVDVNGVKGYRYSANHPNGV